MKKIGWQILIATAATSFLLGSCSKKQPPITKEQVIEEKLQERVERWKADLEKRCLDEAMDRAIAIVDSTIIANARLNRDTAGKPNVPVRPVKPEFVIPKDSTPVKPLLKEKKDSLGKGNR